MRSKNLSFIKFIAALLVIVSHTYPVTGANVSDPMSRLTKGAFTFGGFAVAIFFFASGFFVTKSIIRKEAKGFWKGRFVRIYPAFAVVILVSAFVMGPIISEITVGEYFTSLKTYRYLGYLVMIPSYYLPGVFENNPYAGVVNGALWSIILEVICYTALWVVYKFGLLNKKSFVKTMFISLVLVAIVAFCGKISAINPLIGYIRPVFVFAVGVIFAVCQENLKVNGLGGFVSAVLFVGLIVLGYGNIGLVIAFPYLLYCVVFAKIQVPELLSKTGDYSYSIYLVGFPIQQLMVYSGLGETVIANAILSILLSIAVGFILYKLVEKPFSKKFG